jgi:hypothetical protein
MCFRDAEAHRESFFSTDYGFRKDEPTLRLRLRAFQELCSVLLRLSAEPSGTGFLDKEDSSSAHT